MGYDARSWSVHGRVSRHNSERDIRDNELWRKMTAELSAVCNKTEYAEVMSFHDDSQEY